MSSFEVYLCLLRRLRLIKLAVTHAHGPSVGQIFAARWELVGKHKSREHCRRDCVTRATVAEAIDVEYATGYPTALLNTSTEILKLQ